MFSKSLITVLFCVYCGCGSFSTSESNTKPSPTTSEVTKTSPVSNTPQINRCSNPKWKAPTFRGIQLGVAKENELLSVFGKPILTHEEEQEVEQTVKDSEPHFLMRFKSSEPSEAYLEFQLGKRTKIVKGVFLFYNPRITKDEAISKFGNDYCNISAGESICHPISKSNDKEALSYPRILVYPDKGMYVLYDADSEIIHVGYLNNCEN